MEKSLERRMSDKNLLRIFTFGDVLLLPIIPQMRLPEVIKDPTNPEYLEEVEVRIDTFLVHHPYLKRNEVPAEMVTASGSGLDPHITPQSAEVQIKRVAKARGMQEDKVRKIVEENTEAPLLGLFGTAKVNVLKLNVALDQQNK